MTQEQTKQLTGDITPLPWYTERVFTTLFIGAKSRTELTYTQRIAQFMVNNDEYTANANYIVKACNHFPELVEELEKCYEYFRYENDVRLSYDPTVIERFESLRSLIMNFKHLQ